MFERVRLRGGAHGRSAVWRKLPLLLLLVGGWTAAARADEIARRLEQLLARDAGGRVGLLVVDLNSGRVRFESDADVLLKPASVLKLFTTAAALERFGPQFRFETRFHLRDGELVVLGGGDPSLGDDRLDARSGRSLAAHFDEWAGALRKRGVSSLRGIVLDDSRFDRQWRHPDWPADQALEWYQAPVGAFNLNDNCLDATVELGAAGPRLSLMPPLSEELIRSQLERGSKHAPRINRRIDGDIFEFSGPVSKSHSFGPTAAGDPTLFFADALRHALARRGIQSGARLVRQRVDPASLPAGSLLAQVSTPLPDVLWRANTFSQNLFAECLLKALVAYEPDGSPSGRSGSWDEGGAMLVRTLAGLGVRLERAQIRDGSGLSHENRVSARQVVALLRAMDRHRARGVFLDSLAVAGREGSMRNRYAALQDRVRGKTGTIREVSALAGYADAADGSRLVFAVLVNGPASELPEQVVRVLCGVSRR